VQSDLSAMRDQTVFFMNAFRHIEKRFAFQYENKAVPGVRLLIFKEK